MNERYKLNAQLAQMLKGGVIMDVNSKRSFHSCYGKGAHRSFCRSTDSGGSGD